MPVRGNMITIIGKIPTQCESEYDQIKKYALKISKYKNCHTDDEITIAYMLACAVNRGLHKEEI